MQRTDSGHGYGGESSYRRNVFKANGDKLESNRYVKHASPTAQVSRSGQSAFDGILEDLSREAGNPNGKRIHFNSHSNEQMPSRKRIRENDNVLDCKTVIQDSAHTQRDLRSMNTDDFDDAYDMTPGSGSRNAFERGEQRLDTEARQIQTQSARFFRQFATPRLPSAASGASETPRKATARAEERPPVAGIESALLGNSPQSATSLRANPNLNVLKPFKVWLKLRNIPGRTIILLDEGMAVQTVFSAIQQKLARKLGGTSVQALSFSLVGSEEQIDPIDVELDDEDTWQEVLAVVSTHSKDTPAEFQAFVEV